PKLVEEIVMGGIDSIAISLDGPRKEEHDFSRGKTGSFEKTMIGLENLLTIRKKQSLNSKVHITLACVINNKNYKQLEEIFILATKLGVDNVSINPVQNTYFTEEDNKNTPSTDLYFNQKKQNHNNTDDCYDSIVDKLLELKKKYKILDSSDKYIKLLKSFFQGKPLPIRCYAPYASIYVDCYKQIIPCGGHFYNSKSIARLEDKRLIEVWNSKEYQDQRLKLKNCRNCYYSCMIELSTPYAILSSSQK
ncbi:MAG: radical SAM protein, partial [Oligoflexia bacterium]|nr:radical SAM protein [Oligoflexia bacterium]